jgi:hypothetical protein
VNDTAASNWLSRFAWFGLLLVLAISIGLVLLIGAGIADPQHAGPLRWQKKLAVPWLLDSAAGANQTTTLTDSAMTAPDPPFTLEITARFSSDSDPAALWRITLAATPAAVDMPSGKEIIAIDGSGNYQHDLDPRRIPFPHLRRIGEYNRLTLNVDKDGLETLRFNNEVVWQGVYPPGLQAAQITLGGHGGWQTDSRLTWAQIALYAPLAPTITNRAQVAWR